MIVGVDASNVRTGGGVSHLVNVLGAADPKAHGIERLRLWASGETLGRLPDRDWLDKVHQPLLDRSLPHRLFWQWFRLPGLAEAGCDLLFSPGGNAPPTRLPLVTMSRNMLPFEYPELFRYGFSSVTLRLLLLRWGQARTFRRADGVIFLTEYARRTIEPIARMRGAVEVVPHGVEARFREQPRPQRPISECSRERPLRLLYVSIIDLYKHSWHVAEGVARLRRDGVPLAIDFVGPSYPPALKRLQQVIEAHDPEGVFLRYRGAIPFASLHELRARADVFVFASSCENMPNTLLEGMAAGFPIACSRRGPMPEILGDGGVYFDPEDPQDIASALRRLAEDPELRERVAARAYARGLGFSWERCAEETLAFIAAVARARDEANR